VPLRIGIDLGGTKIEGIALDGSRELARARVDTPRGDYDATLAAIVDLVANLQQRIPLARRSSESEGGNPESRFAVGVSIPVGLGIPGTISSSTGLVKNANSTWLIGRPLQPDLEARLRRPVRVANDANCFAVSEAADGAASGAGVVFGVIAGTGVGGGLVVNGHIVTGANGIAGEWGHNALPWPDEDDRESPLCYCGKRGCIETFLSGPALAADHERVTGVRLPPPEIVAAATQGDRVAEATLQRYERRMARALASVINIVDPDVIVLGGGMSNIARLYRNVPPLWDAFVFACGGDVVRTRLVPAHHGDSSGVRGAAWLWEP
jgi:fructokinase